MREIRANSLVVVAFALIIFLSGCQKKVPVLATISLKNITATTAESGGKIIHSGRSKIISCGVCVDTADNPATAGRKEADSVTKEQFVATIRGLLPNTTYYIRAYAVNVAGTGYGDLLSFTTPGSVPVLKTTKITDISINSAKSGGVIYSDGGSHISNSGTGYGKVISFATPGSLPKAITLGASGLSTSGASIMASVNAGFLPTEASFEYGENEKYGQIATLSSSQITGKTDTTIVANLSVLKPGTKYHFRVKATNALGTAYGKDSTFVILMTPALSGFLPITKNYSDTSFFIAPPLSNSPGTFTYTSSNPNIAKIIDGKVLITGSGTCTITASQAPAGLFESGSISTIFSMNLVDIDSNIYHTVAIGNQDWMKENLKVTRYRNGDTIPNVIDYSKWISLALGAFSWVNNDTVNLNNRFGALYNWYATADSRKICPTGWHVPSDAEWQVMERSLGMTFTEAEGTMLRGHNQGPLLKDTTGWIKNGTGTNSSGFSAIPAGLRDASTGDFYNIGADACWWTSTEEDENQAWFRNMYFDFKSIYRIPVSKKNGFSVRCVRDIK